MKVRIAGDGTPFGTRVEDEFGRLLPIKRMEIEIDSKPGGYSSVIIWLAPHDVWFDLDVPDATTVAEP